MRIAGARAGGLPLLAAAVVVDTVRSTERLAELGEVAAEAERRRASTRLEQVVADHGGRIVAGTGDGAIALFGTTTAAIAAARTLADARLRIGIGVGDVTLDHGAWRGVAIEEASANERACPPGEVRCSRDALDVATLEDVPILDDVGSAVHIPGAGPATPSTAAPGGRSDDDQRRELGAVLFSHVDLPPVQAGPVEDAALAAVAGFAPRFAKRTGTGVMAAFDSASRALDAAEHLQHLAVLRAAVASPTIGVSAGELVYPESDVYGTTVVEAARLAHDAPPGTVLATVRAARAAGRPVADVADRSLRGIPGAVPCGTVEWKEPPTVAEALGLPPSLDPRPSAFVGRSEEIGALLASIDAGIAGARGGVAIVVGEPGAGKTRLVAEAVARRPDVVALLGRNDEFLDLPFEPVAQMVRWVAERDPRGPAALGPTPEHLLPLVPALRDRFPWLEAPRADEGTAHRRMRAAVDDWLRAVSADGPVVVVVDDLQWASPATVDLLARVVSSAAELPVAVVLTLRSGPSTPHVAELVADGRAQGWRRIDLGGLTAEEVGRLDALVGDEEERARQRAAEITTRSGGNPFLVLELIAASAEGDPERATTASATELVSRRLAQLAPDVLDTLRTAAVVGLDFEPSVLASALGRPLDEVLDHVEVALDARLLQERVAGTRLVLSFVHALTRDALYEGISRLARARHHDRVACALEAAGASHADLARHFRVAAPLGRSVQAIRYTALAAHDAKDAHDAATAAKLYRQARELATEWGLADARLDLEIDVGLGQALRRLGDPAHLDLLYDTVDRAAALGHGDLALEGILACYRGSFRQAFLVDDAIVSRIERTLGLLDPDDDAARALLLGCLAVELAFHPDGERVRATVDAARAAAARTDDDYVVVRVLSMVQWACYHPIEDRVEITDRAEAIARRRGDPRLLFAAADASILTAERLGDGERVRALLEEARALARTIDESDVWWNASRLDSKAAFLAADREALAEVIERGHRIGKEMAQPDAGLRRAAELFWVDYEHGDPDGQRARLGAMAGGHALAPGASGAGFLLRHLDLGMHAEAAAAYDDLRLDLGNERADQTWLWQHAILGLGAAWLGRLDDVATLEGLLAPHAALVANHAFTTVGAVARTLAHLRVAAGDPAGAHDLFERALATNDRVGARSWSARSHLDLAESHVRLGRAPDSAEVAAHLVAVADLCDELTLPLVAERRDRLVASWT